MSGFLGTFINILFYALWAAIFGRVIFSWITGLSDNNPISVLLYNITEPILAPIRRVLPSMGMIDLSPMVAIILLLFIRVILLRLVA